MPTSNASAIAQSIPVPIQDKIISMFDALQNGAVTVGNEVVKYTPDVVNAGLDVVRINGAQFLLYGVMGLVSALVLSRKVFNNFKESVVRDNPGYFALGVFQGIIGVIGVVNAVNLIDIWNYVAVFQPKLYIAHELIEKAMK